MEPHEPTNAPFVSGADGPLKPMGPMGSMLSGLRDKKKLRLVAAVAVIGLAAVAIAVVMLGQHGNTGGTPVAISANVANVSIGSDGLTPKSITVKKGQEITWTNNDPSAHHITADQTTLPSFDTAEPLQQGDTYTYIFDKVGTYHYYDAADPTHFVGTITVE